MNEAGICNSNNTGDFLLHVFRFQARQSIADLTVQPSPPMAKMELGNEMRRVCRQGQFITYLWFTLTRNSFSSSHVTHNNIKAMQKSIEHTQPTCILCRITVYLKLRYRKKQSSHVGLVAVRLPHAIGSYSPVSVCLSLVL